MRWVLAKTKEIVFKFAKNFAKDFTTDVVQSKEAIRTNYPEGIAALIHNGTKEWMKKILHYMTSKNLINSDSPLFNKNNLSFF